MLSNRCVKFRKIDDENLEQSLGTNNSGKTSAMTEYVAEPSRSDGSGKHPRSGVQLPLVPSPPQRQCANDVADCDGAGGNSIYDEMTDNDEDEGAATVAATDETTDNTTSSVPCTTTAVYSRLHSNCPVKESGEDAAPSQLQHLQLDADDNVDDDDRVSSAEDTVAGPSAKVYEKLSKKRVNGGNGGISAVSVATTTTTAAATIVVSGGGLGCDVTITVNNGGQLMTSGV